jgi:hypothetical protein
MKRLGKSEQQTYCVSYLHFHMQVHKIIQLMQDTILFLHLTCLKQALHKAQKFHTHMEETSVELAHPKMQNSTSKLHEDHLNCQTDVQKAIMQKMYVKKARTTATWNNTGRVCTSSTSSLSAH